MNSQTELTLSPLPKTWIFDLDGTLVKQNGIYGDGDELLPGVREMIDELPGGDCIIIVTARAENLRLKTEEFLKSNNIRYNHMIFNVPTGERILINDIKKSGLITAYAVNLERDVGLLGIHLTIDNNL